MEGDGFVVVTTASDCRMLEIHNRRPLVLSHEQAREWRPEHLATARPGCPVAPPTSEGFRLVRGVEGREKCTQ